MSNPIPVFDIIYALGAICAALMTAYSIRERDLPDAVLGAMLFFVAVGWLTL